MAYSAGDLVHFVVPASTAPLEIGGTRHGGVVMVVEDNRCLLALSPSKLNLYPWLQVGDAKTKMIGLTWLNKTVLKLTHERCQTTLTMTQEEAKSLQDKILLHRQVLEALESQGRCWDLPGKPKTQTPPQSPRPTPPPSPRQQSLKPRKQFATPANTTQPGSQRPGQAASSFNERSPFDALMTREPPGASRKPGHPDSFDNSPNISPAATPPATDIQQEHLERLLHPVQDGVLTNASWGSQPPRSREEKKVVQDSDSTASQYMRSAFDEGLQAMRSLQSQLQADMDQRLAAYSDSIAKSCASLRTATESIELIVSKGSAPGYSSSSELPRVEMLGANVALQGASTRPESKRLEIPVALATVQGAGTGKLEKMDFNYHVQMLKERNISKNDGFSLGALTSQRDRDELTNKHCCIPKPLAEFVHGHLFSTACCVMALLFAVSVGIQSEVDIKYALSKESPPQWPTHIVSGFNIWFAFEVLLRLLVDVLEFFCGSEWRWNIFDLFLVALSIVDLVAEGLSLGFFRILRSVKVIKALRIVRVFKFFTALRMLVSQVCASMAALLWSLLFLFMVAYLCAVVFLQAAALYIWNDAPEQKWILEIQEFYPNLSTALYTLLASITGGVDWVVAAEVTWEWGPLFGGGFLMFVLVSILGLLNVVTSVFVERASNMRSIDRDFAISKELRQMESDLEETVGLFDRLDGNDPATGGTIDLNNLMNFLKEPDVIARFLMLGIDVCDRQYIASTIDHDATGEITIEKFVHGCFALRGQAKKSDTVAIMSGPDTVAIINGLEDVKKEVACLINMVRPARSKPAR